MSPPDITQLNARGRWPPPEGPRVAIVGSRRPTPYGEAVAEELALGLARSGVVVISGRDKGKTGEVLRVLPAESRVVVQGVNLAKRHTRPRMGEPGGIIERELSIHISNVAHIDPQSRRPTRVGYPVEFEKLL